MILFGLEMALVDPQETDTVCLSNVWLAVGSGHLVQDLNVGESHKIYALCGRKSIVRVLYHGV